MEQNLKQNAFNWDAWVLAIRPRTLPAAVAGVVMGAALSWRDGYFRLDAVLVCLFTALLLQIGSNLANDVFDFERGTDAARQHGPLRVTQSGLLTPAQVKTGMWVVFALAALAGLYLAFSAGWIVILIGLAAIVSAIAYTGGPFPLGYHGLGDIFVFIFFGLASVAGTFFVQARYVSPAAWMMAVPLGLLIVGILVVNNLRDIDTDKLAGKHTLAVKFGEKFTKVEYISCIVIAYLSLLGFCIAQVLPFWSLLSFLSLPVAWKNIKIVLSQKGKALNAALGGTGQLALLYSVLFFVGLMISLV